MRPLRSFAKVAIATLLFGSGPSIAQQAPTGTHYAGRQSDTGHTAAGGGGSYSTAISLDLPGEREGLPIPVAVVYRGLAAGAAGRGWDVPIYSLQHDRTFAHRRPSYTHTYALPTPREMVSITLPGSSHRLVRKGDVWIPSTGSSNIIVRQSGNEWYAYDGAGRTFIFRRPAYFSTLGPWLLDTIRGANGSQLRLVYDISSRAIDGGTASEFNLVRVLYNFHPTAGCAKHEISLYYGNTSPAPLFLSVVGSKVQTRTRTLSSLDVKSRADCSSVSQMLRQYRFQYEPDADNGLPRLKSVQQYGRQGTPEQSVSLPAGQFEYGSVTRGLDKLQYDLTQITPLPVEHSNAMISGTSNESTGPVAGPGQRYNLWQSLTDLTGDGRPDLVLKKNGKLWLSHNRPAPSGTTSFLQPLTPLQDGPLAAHTSSFLRFWYDTATRNTVNVWRQLIDVNGDGRLDRIDAAEVPDKWVIYLNVPGGLSGVSWQRRPISIKNLRLELQSRGHTFTGNYLPISRRVTGTSVSAIMCLRRSTLEPLDGTYNISNGTIILKYNCDDGMLVSRSPPLEPAMCPEDVTPPCDLPPKQEPERSLTDWELNDLNGDSYPDFVFNSRPVEFVISTFGTPIQHTDDYIFTNARRVLQLRPGAGVRVAYNSAGVRFDHDDSFVFSRSVALGAHGPELGVGAWISEDMDGRRQRQAAGFADINGDGLAERIVNSKAYLGAYIGTAVSHLAEFVTLPGDFAQQENNRHAKCPGNGWFQSWARQAMRDVNGDGIADHVGGGVALGTGAGFTAKLPVSPNFMVSHQTESCDGKFSNTDGGLFDVDGDGVPEVVGLTPDPSNNMVYHVSQLVGTSGPRALDSGRLVTLSNGHGQQTRITYGSAKDDRFTSHQVPFPEIVVTQTETVGTLGLGGTVAPRRYAYGRASMIFDSFLDRFVFGGYAKTVDLQLYAGRGPQAFAVVTDNWPLTPFNIAATKAERLLRVARAGLPRDVMLLRGSAELDPWPLLNVDIGDTRVISVNHKEWGSKEFTSTPGATATFRDCMEMTDPYNFQQTLLGLTSGSRDICRSYGFAYGKSQRSWYGGSPPPSSTNLQTGSELLEIDDLGRPVFARYDNDLNRSDDDICVEYAYAVPVSPYPRVTSALHQGRTTDCGRRITYSKESWIYDGLAPGLVGAGRLTANQVERRATDNGAPLGTLSTYSASYDALGNLVGTNVRRGSALQSSSVEYDAFKLVPTRVRISAPGLQPTEGITSYDYISLDALSSTDANGSTRGTVFDGFGRPTRLTFAARGEGPKVGATFGYEGFGGPDPLGQRVSTTRYTDPIPDTAVGTTRGKRITTWFDELGRVRFSDLELGADYQDGVLRIGRRTYDDLGRVSFLADPHLAPAAQASLYGTTYHFDNIGDLTCAIRGFGVQPLSPATNLALERVPTCFEHQIIDNVAILKVRDAESLHSTSPHFGVTKRTVSTAAGQVLEQATVKGSNVLDLATFAYDRLGQQTSLTRYLDPLTRALPVRWSWRLDSTGRTLSLASPEASTQSYAYNEWGELAETRWTEAGEDRRLVRAFDALGRLVSAEERINGVADPATVVRYEYDQVSTTVPLLTPRNLLGRLARAASPTQQLFYSYDELGRTEARVFLDAGGVHYVERTYHHGDGNLAYLELNLPDQGYQREVVKYGYDSAGRLKSVSHSDPLGQIQLFQAENIDALGTASKVHLGNLIKLASDYPGNGRNLLRETILETPAGFRQVLRPTYDALSREVARTEASGPTNAANGSTTYDDLGRISTSVRTAGSTTTSSWTYRYDALGNIVAADDLVGSNDVQMSFRAGDKDQVCRVEFSSAPATGPCNVVHDGLGRITSQPTRAGPRATSYFLSGQPRSIANPTAQADIRYDPFGNAQDVRLASNNGLEVRHDRRFGGMIERRELTSNGNTKSLVIRNIPGPGGVLARRLGTADGWIFDFSELHGTRHVANDAGTFVQDIQYAPFGETSAAGPSTTNVQFNNRQWNGGDALTSLGVSQLGARLYDPVLGRFLSRDPILVPRSGSRTNPYSFAQNDPLNGADPSGLQCIGQECMVWFTPVFGPMSGVGVPGGTGLPTGDVEHAAAKPATSGPQTFRGRVMKIRAESHFGITFDDGFNWDTFMQGGKSVSEALETLAQTQDVHASIDAYNDNLDGWASSAAGIGDALNWTCLWPLCKGSDLRAGLGISSGDAKPVQYTVGNIMGAVSTFFLPKPSPLPSAPVFGGGAITPRAAIRNVNPTKGTTNCVNCALAAEATLAGRPASALPGGLTWPDAVEWAANAGRQLPLSRSLLGYSSPLYAFSTKGVRAIMTGWGTGSRALVLGNRASGPGHAFNVVNQNGKIIFVDGQPGGAANLSGFVDFLIIRMN